MADVDNTSRKRGKGLITPSDNPKPFTSDNQPTDEAKSAGKQKKKFTREAWKVLLEMPYKFPLDSSVKKQLIQAFGEKKINSMTVGQLIGLQQAQKAILKGDSIAATTIMNQVFGLPKQDFFGELTGRDGQPLFPSPIFKLPDGTEVTL